MDYNELPAQLKAPALPHVIALTVSKVASDEAFVTISKCRDLILKDLVNNPAVEFTTQDINQELRELLYRRVRYALPTVKLINNKVKVVEALTPSRTKIFKIYYHAG